MIALLLTACGDPAAAPVAPAAPATIPASTGAECGVPRLMALVGRHYDAELATLIRNRAGTPILRAIRPGRSVTMDYRVDRLNVLLDAKDRVTGFRCG